LPFFSKLEPCLIGMEACSSAHHWARELTALGHDVRLIPPMYVKPYVKCGKSDAIDAEAICEAVTRPTMRFVAVKTVEQQALLSLHRARNLLIRQRTQLINGLRGMVRSLHNGQRSGNNPASYRRFSMTTWVDACALNDIEQEEVIRFDHSGKTYAIFRSPDDEYFCTDGLCTHEQVHLSDGLVMDYTIECPKHSGEFDYRTGEAKRAPVCVDLSTFQTRVEGDRVLVLI
jgi:MocE subfamily Rieske [2Fe-2S] domain protein